MQTFVPYTSFKLSAASLDNKRLNKQLLEGRQIFQIVAEDRRTGGWVNHPAVKMWRGHDVALMRYLLIIKEECDSRGIQTEKNWKAIADIHFDTWMTTSSGNLDLPPWWGDNRVHESHKFNLYRKDPQHYHHFYDAENSVCCDKCNYFWPTHTTMYGVP